jgi:hypothetical protein
VSEIKETGVLKASDLKYAEEYNHDLIQVTCFSFGLCKSVLFSQFLRIIFFK